MGGVWRELGLISLLLSCALLVIAVCTKDWSRLSTTTTMWENVDIEDHWGLWAWSSVLTTTSSTVRLQFEYDYCGHADTVDECHTLLAARGFAIATALLEAGAVLSAIVIECRVARRQGFSAEYACISLTLLHVIAAVLALVMWSSVQDTLRAQDVIQSGTITFGFSWYLVLISAAFSLPTVITLVNHLTSYTTIYERIEGPTSSSFSKLNS